MTSVFDVAAGRNREGLDVGRKIGEFFVGQLDCAVDGNERGADTDVLGEGARRLVDEIRRVGLPAVAADGRRRHS